MAASKLIERDFVGDESRTILAPSFDVSNGFSMESDENDLGVYPIKLYKLVNMEFPKLAKLLGK